MKLLAILALLTILAKTAISQNNNFFNQATLINLPYTDTATINPVNDIDIYRMNLTRGGVLTVATANVPASIQIVITFHSSDSGCVIASASSNSFQTVVPSGTYYVKINDNQNNGSSATAYTIMIALDTTDNLEFNNFFNYASEITPDTTFQASIFGFYPDTCAGGTGTGAAANDRDIYKVQLTRGGVLTVAIANVPPDIQPEIIIYTSSDTVCMIAKDINDSLQAVVPAGTCYVMIFDSQNNDESPSTYTVTVALDTTDNLEFNNYFNAASWITPDTTFLANIFGFYGPCSGGLSSGANDRDIYFFTNDYCTNFEVNTSNVIGVQLEMRIYNAIDTNTHIIHSDSGQILTFLAPGLYYLKINDNQNNHTNSTLYTVSITSQNVLSTPSISPNGPLNVAQFTVVPLTSSAAFYNNWSTGDTLQTINYNALQSGYVVLWLDSVGCLSGADSIQINVITGIDFPDFNAYFSIYPNPVQTHLLIESEQIFDHISVLDIRGTKLISQKYYSGVDISQLEKGIYFIEISGKKGTAMKKFVKM